MPGYTGIVNDGAAAILEHDRNFVTHRIENAPNVDVEDAAIFGFGCLIERAFPFNAGIVKRDVEPTEFVDRKIDHRFHVCLLRDVSADKRCRAAVLFDFCDDARTFFFTSPSEDDLGAGASKCDSGGFTYAGSSSSHECNFALNSFSVCLHYVVLFYSQVDYAAERCSVDETRRSSSAKRDSYDSHVGQSPLGSTHSGCCRRKASCICC